MASPAPRSAMRSERSGTSEAIRTPGPVVNINARQQFADATIKRRDFVQHSLDFWRASLKRAEQPPLEGYKARIERRQIIARLENELKALDAAVPRRTA